MWAPQSWTAPSCYEQFDSKSLTEESSFLLNLSQNFSWQNKSAKFVRSEVTEIMRDAYTFMIQASPTQVITSIFSKASPDLQKKMNREISRIDHVGFILPQSLTTELVHQAANETGIFHFVRSFSSTIVARELGSKLGIDLVPTQISIFETQVADGKPLAIEIFMPTSQDSILQDWIRSGVGSHIAMRMNNRQGFIELTEELIAQGFQMPAFMNSKMMENPHQKSLTSYFDIPVNGKLMRIELIYVEE